METYSDLSIHQKINAKANSLVYYKRMRLKYVVCKHPDLFGYDRMLLEVPGQHSNRNYDGPEPDYNGWSAGEESERQAKCQREIK